MLKLRIENLDQLPDGGPLEFTADRHGFDFGRDQHLDWSLPDQSGVISRKHCEVRFFEQAYWLFDLSTNGTFINDSKRRIQSPHKLAQGDEIRVGDYIISVTIALGSAASNAFAVDSPSALPAISASRSLWDASGHVVPPPIDPRELMPPTPESRRAPDFLQQHVQLPPAPEPTEPDKFRSRAGVSAPTSDIWENEPAVASEIPEIRPAQAEPHAATPPVRSLALERIATANASSESSQAVAGEFVRRFATAAGLAPDALLNRTSGELAEELGRLFNLVCANLMQMLNARAEAKALARSGSRTLIRPNENNPLKFTPTAEEALRVMLGGQSHGYLTAIETLEKSFMDIKSHQMAVLSAMQLAAQSILTEFSPEEIRKAGEASRKSLLGSGRSKYWEVYTEKWQQKAGQGEHGMLSTFLDLFSDYYDQESGKLK